jgi:hypothetical protein
MKLDLNTIIAEAVDEAKKAAAASPPKKKAAAKKSGKKADAQPTSDFGQKLQAALAAQSNDDATAEQPDVAPQTKPPAELDVVEFIDAALKKLDPDTQLSPNERENLRTALSKQFNAFRNSNRRKPTAADAETIAADIAKTRENPQASASAEKSSADSQDEKPSISPETREMFQTRAGIPVPSTATKRLERELEILRASPEAKDADSPVAQYLDFAERAKRTETNPEKAASEIRDFGWILRRNNPDFDPNPELPDDSETQENPDAQSGAETPKDDTTGEKQATNSQDSEKEAPPEAAAEKPKRQRKGQGTKPKDDTKSGTPADAPKEAPLVSPEVPAEAPLVSPEPAAEKPKRQRKGQGTKPTAAADAGTPAEAPKEAPLVSPEAKAKKDATVNAALKAIGTRGPRNAKKELEQLKQLKMIDDKGIARLSKKPDSPQTKVAPKTAPKTAPKKAGTTADTSTPTDTSTSSPADTSASSERPPRTPEQQARRDAWLASQGQSSSAPSRSSERPPRTPEQQARRDAWLASQGQQPAAGKDQDKQQPAAAQSPEEKQAAVDKRLKRMFGIERTKRSIGDRLKGAWRGFTADAGEDLGKASGGYRSVFHEVQRLMEQYRLIGRILHEQSLYEGLAGQQGKLDVAPPFGQLTAADFAKLRRRQKHIKEALAMQIVREQLYTHHTTLAELNINQRNALMELVKSRCDEMFCRLDETDADNSGEDFAPPRPRRPRRRREENPYAYLDDEYDAPPAPKGGHVNMRMATLKLVDRARNAHRRRREELGEANLSPSDAKNILDTHDAHDDFHALKKDKVEALLAAAKNAKYRKGKNAPGSTGRMFHQHLTRLARKA